MADSLMNTHNRLPVAFDHGKGAWLWDTQGKKYLDAIAGIAVCGLGHAHPAVAEALCAQSKRLLHTSNIYTITKQQELGAELARLSGLDKVFFCNSGAEANEAAIKLARLHGHRKNIEVPAIIVMEGSFHGRTLATLAATGNKKIQAGFEPLVQGFVRAPYNDIGALNRIAQKNHDVAAVLVEPVQGEGGIQIPDDDYLAAVRAVCDEHGWLMMLDEVQTGMCRTGKWFAFQYTGVTPDVMTLAKSLGNGVPIGACLARGAAAGLFQPGSHATTFGGNPLVCSAALAVVKTLVQEKLGERAALLGARMLAGFTRALEGQGHVAAIRGKGLMIGIELNRPCADLVPRALAQGLLINVTAERVVRLLPPLVISETEADQIVAGVSELIKNFAGAA
ncbi:MAG: aspartate aminotransferase family protein [Gammaproteobacteria bacterium]|nr:MAG: aspartate aminotransferase family protein [Gammaproteobacteria bacterium]